LSLLSLPNAALQSKGNPALFLAFLPLITPVIFIALAVVAFRGPQMRPTTILQQVETGALGALAVAAVSALMLILIGAATSPLIGAGGLGLSIRLDAVSAVMLLLVAFVGWVVVRFSATYMDGETRQGPFTGWLCLTLAAVMFLVTSGNILQFVLLGSRPA
jgi:NAD(P)H-quinone oxidoreductase subunit 5